MSNGVKVSIIGAGHVGSALAFKLIEEQLSEVVLLDKNDQLAAGKTLDLQDAASIIGSKSSIYHADSYKQIKDSKVVVVTAGFPRKPGMDREDLLLKNAQIIKEVSSNLKRYVPDAIVIMVTNPLDVMTYVCKTANNYKREQVVGMAGILDSARLKVVLAKMLNVGLEEIETIVLGAHGDSMVALESQTYIKNKPWTEFIDENKLKEAFNYAKKEGSKIVSLLQGGSAYFAPALSIYKMIDNILNNKKELISASCYLDGEYGLKDVCVGVPVRLGSQGVEKIVELDLTNDELSKLHQAANLIKSNNRKIV